MCCVCVELDGMSGGGKDIAVLITARLLCRMAVAMDSLAASERLDFSQCVTKMDRNNVGPILFLV